MKIAYTFYLLLVVTGLVIFGCKKNNAPIPVGFTAKINNVSRTWPLTKCFASIEPSSNNLNIFANDSVGGITIVIARYNQYNRNV